MKEFIDKLISRLEEKARWVAYGARDRDIGMTHKVVPFSDIREIGNQLAEEYKGGWISVEDRLPEETTTKDGHIDPSEEVLVYIYYGENCVSNGYKVSRYWSHSVHFSNPWIDLKSGKENVIAWKPIEPYQKEGE